MNSVRFFPFLFLVFLFGNVSAFADTGIADGETDAVLQAKRALPLCAPGASLYTELMKLGERPFGVGVENSKLAKEAQGLLLGFTRDPKTLAWSFLTTDNTKTCFVAMGKKWRKTEEESMDTVFRGDIKQTGYSAPFATLKAELLKEGKTQAGFDDEDLDLLGTNLLKKTIYFFIDNSGSFTTVTSITYKRVGLAPFEISSIDAVGSHWVWVSPDSYNNSDKN
jgi:hypothetical protein